MNRRLVLGAAAVVAVIIVLILAYNRWWSPAARVKARVESAAKAFSTKETARVLEALSPDFGQDGLDKGGAARAMGIFFAEFEKVKVNLGEHKVSVNGEDAVDSIGVVVVVSKGGQQGYLLGQFGNPARLGVKLKRRGKWLITGVDGLPGYY